MRDVYQPESPDGLSVWGDPKAELLTHYQNTVAKCAQEDEIVLVQGSTELPYALGRDGPDMWKTQKGYLAHAGLAVSTTNQALGLVCLRPWTTRKDMGELWSDELPGNRWLDGLEGARKIVQHCPTTAVHHVCDVAVGDGLHGLVRAHRDQGSNGTLWVRVTKPGMVRIKFAASKRAVQPSRHLFGLEPIVQGFGFQYGGSGGTKSRYSRAIRVTVRAAVGRLQPKSGKATAVTAILVTEDKAPGGSRPVKWLFVAPGQDLDTNEIQKLLSKYEQYWTLTNYFRTLKVGVKAERRTILDYYGDIQSRVAYEDCLAQDGVAAVTVSELRRFAVDAPDTPAEDVLNLDILRRLLG